MAILAVELFPHPKQEGKTDCWEIRYRKKQKQIGETETET